MPRRILTRNGCQNCRARHVRCDDRQPACARCAKSAIECVRGFNVRFRHGTKTDYDFGKKQPWVKISRTLTFLDETQELMSLYDRDQDETFIESTPRMTHSQALPSLHLTNISKSTQSTFRNIHSECTSSLAPIVFHETTLQPPQKRRRLTCDGEKSFGNPLWPLKEREEAMLLRHYVERLARNFDLTDPQQHFRLVVPTRAGTCPTLLNAILALSARHLSRIATFDPFISNKYHQECLQHLIPMLDDNAAILDENLLASTIILRHLEELEVPVSGQDHPDQQSYLLGAHALITAQERATISGGLRQAAFWVGLRQEVYVAFVNQRSIMPALEHCNIDRSFEPAEDHVWSCRMVVLCADVIRYCFGDSPQTTTTYNSLADSVAEWYHRKPSSFSPVYYRAATASPLLSSRPKEVNNNNNHHNGDKAGEQQQRQHQPDHDDDKEEPQIFPDLWFVNDVHTLGLQHYHLARILLSAHDPRVPRLGPGRQAAISAVDAEIRSHVLVLCGISRSNASTAPNFGYAAMAVTMAGDKFGDRKQQEALLDVLVQCEWQHGWPTSAAQRNLRVAWGWEEEISEG